MKTKFLADFNKLIQTYFSRLTSPSICNHFPSGHCPSPNSLILVNLTTLPHLTPASEFLRIFPTREEMFSIKLEQNAHLMTVYRIDLKPILHIHVRNSWQKYQVLLENFKNNSLVYEALHYKHFFILIWICLLETFCWKFCFNWSVFKCFMLNFPGNKVSYLFSVYPTIV